MKVKDHAQLVAAANGAYAALHLVAIAVLMAMSVFGLGLMAPALQEEFAKDPDVRPDVVGGFMALLFGIATCVVGIQVLVSGLAAVGVWKATPWGRVLAIIAAVLSVLSFPLGTAVGVYTFWFAFGDVGRKWFESAGRTEAE